MRAASATLPTRRALHAHQQQEACSPRSLPTRRLGRQEPAAPSAGHGGPQGQARPRRRSCQRLRWPCNQQLAQHCHPEAGALLADSARSLAAAAGNGVTDGKKAKSGRHMGREMLDFINEAWTQFHAVGAPRWCTACMEQALTQAGLVGSHGRRMERPPPSLCGRQHSSCMQRNRPRLLLCCHATLTPCPRSRGQPAPGGGRLCQAVGARPVAARAWRALLLHTRAVHAGRFRCGAGLPAGQPLPPDRRPHRQVRAGAWSR